MAAASHGITHEWRLQGGCLEHPDTSPGLTWGTQAHPAAESTHFLDERLGSGGVFGKQWILLGVLYQQSSDSLPKGTQDVLVGSLATCSSV